MQVCHFLILRYCAIFTRAYACAAIHAFIRVKYDYIFSLERTRWARLHTTLAFLPITTACAHAPAVFPAAFVVIDCYHCLSPQFF